MHWLSIVILSGGAIGVFKLFIYLPRPGGILYEMYTSSFPSAHAVLGLTFYGFLAVIIARELKASKRYLVYVPVGILLAMIGFSRIYLGAHWLIDVLGGIFLGFIVLLVVAISYRRRHILHFYVRKFILVAGGVFFTVWLGYSVAGFSKQMQEYNLIWPTQVHKFNQLIREKTTEIPLYRLNRFGRPIEALNVIYVGNLPEIGQVLSQHGWESQKVALDFQGILKSLLTTSTIHHLSVFPQLYHNKRMELLYTKNTDVDNVVLILRLWPSDINLKDSDLPLWLGTIEYHQASPHTFSLQALKKKQIFIGATDFLARYLAKDFYLWKKNYSIDKQPPEMRELQWDGKMLIIKYRGRGI